MALGHLLAVRDYHGASLLRYGVSVSQSFIGFCQGAKPTKFVDNITAKKPRGTKDSRGMT